jgi:predicted nucleotidyltransferase
MNQHQNIEQIKIVTKALGQLNKDVVFVGGTTLPFYADLPVTDVRPTDDIDIIVELVTYKERTDFDQKLLRAGFRNDTTSPVVCRYKIDGITVDIMPTNDPSIGFKNSWYAEGFHNTLPIKIGKEQNISILTAPYFIATKFEAFLNRGKGDGRISHDFEDIVFVLENRTAVWAEMNSSTGKINAYLKQQFLNLSMHTHIYEWIDGHVTRSIPPMTAQVLAEMKKFSSN